MNTKLLNHTVCLLLMILLLGVNSGSSRTATFAQESVVSHKVISRETYDRVLDTLFEHEESLRDYDLILRFEPSAAPESQIVIRTKAGQTQLVEYTSLSGNVYRKLDRIVANGGTQDAVQLAKQFQIGKRLFEVPKVQILKWRSRLPATMAASMKLLERRSLEAAHGTGTITLDGTFYTLWYDQAGSSFLFRAFDHEVSDREITGELELVRWMNAVRREVERLKSQR